MASEELRASSRQHCVIACHTEQTQAHHQHAGNGAALERDIERGIEAAICSLRGAHVRAHRYVHADEAGRTGKNGADGEADGGRQVEER